MTAAALTEEDRADLPRALKGNICRCTGYGSIADALAGLRGSPTATAASATGAPSPVGSGLPAPAGPDVVTGRARFTLDTAIPGLLHMKLVRSPHAHARIRAVDASAALARPGVAAVFSYADDPGVRYSTGRHHHPGDDACDTLLFDRTVRFTGQRVAAVVADSAHAAALACALVRVDYEVLPAVVDPDLAMAPGAPVLHPGLRLEPVGCDPERNVAAEVHGGSGDIAAGFAAADTTYEQTFRVQRVQHVHLETHATIGWMDEGRLVLRTSSQTPFLTRDALCAPVRAGAQPGPGVRGAGRRRVRRQAGDAHRGRGRAGRAPARPAGPAGVHPRGAVHRGHHPARDADHGPARCPPGRHAHRDAAAHGRGHRRVRQPRRRRAVPQLQRGDQPVPLPGQAGRRLVGVHQHGPGRRVPRVRAVPVRVRGRVGARRAGPVAGPRPARGPPPERGPPRRPAAVRQRRAGGRADRQLRAGPVPRPGVRRAGQRARAAGARGGRLADRHRRRGQHAGHGAARRAPGPRADRAAGRRRVPARGRHGRVRQRDHDRAPAARRERAGLRRRRHRDRVGRHRRGRARHRRVRVDRHVRGRDGDAAGRRVAGRADRRGGSGRAARRTGS